MIKLYLIAERGKIHTDFKEEDITLEEVSLLVFEMERIKNKLVEKEWNVNLKLEKEVDDENDIEDENDIQN